MGPGGPVRPDMTIVTRGERIEVIVPQAELKPPPGAEVVDVKAQQTEMGTLEAGKLANIVFLSRNPLGDIGAIREVTLTVKRGAHYQRKDYVPVTKAEVAGHL